MATTEMAEAKEDLVVSVNGGKEEGTRAPDSVDNPPEEKKDVFQVPSLPPPVKSDFQVPDIPVARPAGANRGVRGPSKLVIRRPAAKPSKPEEEEKPVENEFVDKKAEENSGTSGKSSDSSESDGTAPDEVSFSRPVSKPIPYVEPKWSGCPSSPYRLEVIKGGKIIEKINLTERPYTVFGRARNCHVELEHPSISRFHAVVQCRAPQEGEENQEEDEPCKDAFFVYDLGSTHGTTVNKEQVRPRAFYRLRLGHMLKFGGSSRMFVLVSDDGDPSLVEADAATEERHILEQRLKEAQKFGKMDDDLPENVEQEDSGIDWGFGEDAVDEEAVMAERPDFEALAQLRGGKEAYFEKDPKKALKAFFDREGLDMEFDVKESGPGSKKTFTARVQLPIQSPSGAPVYGEASVTGKKRDAMLAAALDACRLLDSQGMLREHVSTQKRKKHDWAENDYYDSDEDTFLDRTGTVERKRQKRMQGHRKGSKSEPVDNYDSLVAKLESVQKEKAGHLEALENDRLAAKEGSGGDSLDAFMTSLSGRLDPSARRKLHQSIAILKKEEARLEKLIALVAPAKLPELVKTDSTANPDPTEGSCADDATSEVAGAQTKGADSRGYGLVTVEKRVQPQAKRAAEVQEGLSPQPAAGVEGMVEEEEIEEQASVSQTKAGGETDSSGGLPEKASTSRRVIGPALGPIRSSTDSCPPEQEEDEDDEKNDTGVSSGSAEDESRRRKRKRERQRQREQKRSRGGVSAVLESMRPSTAEELNNDPDIASWLPPQDQSGDGRTKLNEKLGY